MCAERVSPRLKVVLRVALRNAALNTSDTGTAVSFGFFSVITRVLEGSSMVFEGLCRTSAVYSSTKSCLSGVLPPLFSINAQRHVVLAAVIVAQSMRSGILNEAGNVQSHLAGPCL